MVPKKPYMLITPVECAGLCKSNLAGVMRRQLMSVVMRRQWLDESLVISVKALFAQINWV